VRAAREVIVERGYPATTLQAIAKHAGLSRPTLHYYFATRYELYEAVVGEARAVVADCVAQALRHDRLLKRLSAYFAALYEADDRDRSIVAFLVTARLESRRNPELRTDSVVVLRAFLTRLIEDAIAGGELPADTDNAAIVEMLHAIVWGIGFYAGFVDRTADMRAITKQLDYLLAHGLLEARPGRVQEAADS
jgi:AcrR family transcriptional regulator